MRVELVETALRNAAATTRIEQNTIWHSGRGSVCTCASFRTLVKDVRIRSSMGRTGIRWDRAAVESFFSALKHERVYRTVYATKEQARKDVMRYIEGFCNGRRRHSALDYQYPHDVRYRYQQPGCTGRSGL
jgi:transposase InsO family protein